MKTLIVRQEDSFQEMLVKPIAHIEFDQPEIRDHIIGLSKEGFNDFRLKAVWYHEGSDTLKFVLFNDNPAIPKPDTDRRPLSLDDLLARYKGR